MATKCKNEYDVVRRVLAYRRLHRIKHGPYSGMPRLVPFEIFGFKPSRGGIFTVSDILNEINETQ